MSAVAVTVATTPTLLAAAKHQTKRGWLLISVNKTEGAVPVFVGIGAPDVTTLSGSMLSPGESITIKNDDFSFAATAAVYAVTESGTQSVSVQEGA